MVVQDLIFADYAAQNEANKFTLVGAGFNEIFTNKIPCIHPFMYLLVRFKITISDIGKNKSLIRIVGEKGPVFKAEFDIDVDDNHIHEQNLALPIQLVNLKFDAEGDYRCDVIVNGEMKSNQILKITLRESQPAK